MTAKRPVRGASGWIGQVLAWFVIMAITMVLTAGVFVPRITGATPYTILTGSMRPTMPPGTLVVVRPVDTNTLGVGTVVTYQLESGKRPVVTHRIVSMGIDGTGKRIFITQGDANNVADAKPVMPVQIRGKLWYSVPYLGYVNNTLTGSQRQVATYGLAGLLVAYSIYMFTGSLRDRRRERH